MPWNLIKINFPLLLDERSGIYEEDFDCVTMAVRNLLTRPVPMPSRDMRPSLSSVWKGAIRVSWVCRFSKHGNC